MFTALFPWSHRVFELFKGQDCIVPWHCPWEIKQALTNQSPIPHLDWCSYKPIFPFHLKLCSGYILAPQTKLVPSLPCLFNVAVYRHHVRVSCLGMINYYTRCSLCPSLTEPFPSPSLQGHTNDLLQEDPKRDLYVCFDLSELLHELQLLSKLLHLPPHCELRVHRFQTLMGP